MADLSVEDKILINSRVGSTGAQALQPGSLIFGLASGLLFGIYYFTAGLNLSTIAFFAVSVTYLALHYAAKKRYLRKEQRIWAGTLMFALPMTLAMLVVYTSSTLFALPFAIIALFAAAFFITDIIFFRALVGLNVVSYLFIFWLEPLDYSLRLLAGLSFAWLLSLFLNSVVITSLYRLERLRLQEKRYREQLEIEVGEREQAQKALANAYTQVEQQVTERTKALNDSLEREQTLSSQLETSLAKEVELQQMKTSIITNVSHEFRTPLHAINMSVDLLIGFRDQLSAAQSEKYQNNIKDQIFYMTDMIQDILFVNSDYKIILQRNIINFGELCHQLQTDLLDELERTPNIIFDYSENPSKVSIDYPHLKRIAANLLSNALKFSEKGSLIMVMFGLENGRFLLCVRDQGIGIPLDEQDHIFDLFFRGSNIETRRGLGLGLNIVKTIVDAFAGTIAVQSDGSRQGSTFTISLPALPTPLPE